MGWVSTKVTEENADAIMKLMKKLTEERQKKLSKFLPQHKEEIDNLPQILKVRINALKEINPEKFSNSPELVLSTLAASALIKQFPDGAQPQEQDIDKVHKKYHLSQGGDVNPFLVSDIYYAYFSDVKSGAITKSGKINDIEKSRVMRVFHNSESNGLPIDAKETIAKITKPTKTPSTKKEMDR